MRGFSNQVKSSQIKSSQVNIRNLFKLILYFFLLLLSHSCKKDQVIDEQKTSLYRLTYANSNNPYDSVGIFHNNGLKYLCDNNSDWYLQDSSQLISDLKFDLSNYYITKICQLNPNCDSLFITSRMDSLLDFLVLGNTYYLDTLYKDCSLNDYQVAYFDDLIRMNINELEFEDIIDSILSIENEVIEFDLFNSEEKKPILVCSSIYRHSIGYWYYESLNASSCWSNIAGKTNSFNWRAVARGDLNGALAGFVVGIKTGWGSLVFGPNGYVLTIAGTTVTGSLYGSGAGMFIELFKIIFW